MDDRRFDNLARAFARPASRRAAVRSLTASIFGGWLARRVPSEAAAQCGGHGDPCGQDADCCGGRCIGGACCDPSLACGSSCCGLFERCRNGACVRPQVFCFPPAVPCDGAASTSKPTRTTTAPAATPARAATSASAGRAVIRGSFAAQHAANSASDAETAPAPARRSFASRQRSLATDFASTPPPTRTTAVPAKAPAR
ncbi:MAG: hypothetical protein K0Q71_5326, partial [Thermomicrobiales bacterium]|nr:hypothetical protein [Thermomicrobiales bacterium]